MFPKVRNAQIQEIVKHFRFSTKKYVLHKAWQYNCVIIRWQGVLDIEIEIPETNVY